MWESVCVCVCVCAVRHCIYCYFNNKFAMRNSSWSLKIKVKNKKYHEFKPWLGRTCECTVLLSQLYLIQKHNWSFSKIISSYLTPKRLLFSNVTATSIAHRRWLYYVDVHYGSIFLIINNRMNEEYRFIVAQIKPTLCGFHRNSHCVFLLSIYNPSGPILDNTTVVERFIAFDSGRLLR